MSLETERLRLGAWLPDAAAFFPACSGCHYFQAHSHSLLAIAAVEYGDCRFEQEFGGGAIFFAANAIRSHSVTGVGALEQDTDHQIREFRSGRPRLRSALLRALEALAKGIEAGPAFLVFAVQITSAHIRMLHNIDRPEGL